MDVAELSMLLEAMEPREVSQEEFMEAVAKVKTVKKLAQEQQLVLYGLFKQYTAGDVSGPEPEQSDFVAKAKWDAWKGFIGFPRNNAALAYVYIVQQLLMAPESDVPGSSSMDGFGVIVSTLNRQYDESFQWSVNEALFKCVVENDLTGVKTYVEAGEDVNAVKEEGMTALHYAADRGYNEIIEYLLQNGASVNAVDSSGQTALMYAVTCENEEAVKVLLAYGADASIRNHEGQAVTEFDDVPAELLALF